MTWIFLIISLLVAGVGVFLIADFCLWLVKGRVVSATIKGFQAQKNKGLKLPIVLFEDENDREHEAKTQRIDQFLFLFNRPTEDGFTSVVYKKDDPSQARIYGYINIVTGLFLFAPLVLTLALESGSNTALAQLSYALIFGAIALGGWALLKLIQRYY